VAAFEGGGDGTAQEVRARADHHDAARGGGEAVAGVSIREICKQLAITDQTYYRWRKEYGGLKVDQAKRLKELERENARLKKVVADQVLDIAILKEAASGNF